MNLHRSKVQPATDEKRVLITGGAGFLGRSVLSQLVTHARKRSSNLPSPSINCIVSSDIELPGSEDRLDEVTYEPCDVTEKTQVQELIRKHHINTVIHLASKVNIGESVTEEDEYRVDVIGTRNVIAACGETGVERLIVSSSSAAYGYHADNPGWMFEGDLLRGNDEISHSRHKRMIEESLAEARILYPDLEQTVFRIGTVLGEDMENQVTKIFSTRRILAIYGSDSPFVFVWHTDVARVFAQAVDSQESGIYNVAGDGALTIYELAEKMGKKTVTVPAWLVRTGLAIGYTLRMTNHTPTQISFLRYRPVLSNRALVEEFGYLPAKTSAEAFDAFWESRTRSGVHGQLTMSD